MANWPRVYGIYNKSSIQVMNTQSNRSHQNINAEFTVDKNMRTGLHFAGNFMQLVLTVIQCAVRWKSSKPPTLKGWIRKAIRTWYAFLGSQFYEIHVPVELAELVISKNQ
jgi:hypothetical protein